MASHYFNWKSTFSNAKTSSCERFVPIFTSHIVERLDQSSTHFFLATHYAMIDVICIEPKVYSYVVVGMKFLLWTFVSWCGCAMFTLSQFGLAWMPNIGLQCLTLFLRQIRQYGNVSLVFWTLLTPTHWWCETPHSYHVWETPECGPSGSCVKVGDGVINKVVWTMRIILIS